jgi:hypothetical protein
MTGEGGWASKVLGRTIGLMRNFNVYLKIRFEEKESGVGKSTLFTFEHDLITN